jgi:ribulose-5-phosphate 4-epimerase/fuculose-1-phosphate aldolase
MPITMERAAVNNLPISAEERRLRVQLAACYRVFDHLGWTELIFNHITLRVPGPEKIFLINPFGLRYREVTASNLVAIDVEGNPVRSSPYPINRAGFVIHSAIHSSVDRAHCIMHTHTTSGMAVACSQAGLAYDSFYGAQLFGRVAYHDFEGVTVDEGERDRLVADIGSKQAIILRNHGLLAWGESIPEAFLWLWTLQRACDVQVAASACGGLNPIAAKVFEQTTREAGSAEPALCQAVFDALVREIDAKDPSYKN